MNHEVEHVIREIRHQIHDVLTVNVLLNRNGNRREPIECRGVSLDTFQALGPAVDPQRRQIFEPGVYRPAVVSANRLGELDRQPARDFL